jgi:uncharacterized membrane protein (Fun14 family)
LILDISVVRNLEGRYPITLPIENLMFAGGGGFLLGAVAGYAIKKVMKIAAVVIGLFVVGLSYLSYRGWIDVKWMEMENATKATLTNVAGQVGHALNNTGIAICSPFLYSRSSRPTCSSCVRIHARTYVGINAVAPGAIRRYHTSADG